MNSFISLNSDLDLGLISVSDTSLLSLHLGESLGLNASSRSALSIAPNPLSFTITPNTSQTGLMDFSASSSILPFGSYNKQFLTIDAYTPLLLPQHANLEAYSLHTYGRQDFEHSSLDVQTLQTEGEFTLEQGSSLSAKTLVNNAGKTEIMQSTVHAKHWVNQNGAKNYLIASNVDVELMALPDGSGIQTFAAHLNIKQFHVENGALFSAAGYSNIVGEHFVFADKAKIGSSTSDWHVGTLSSKGFALEIESSDAYKPTRMDEIFNYHSLSTLKTGLTRDGIIYAASTKLPIHDKDFVSMLMGTSMCLSKRARAKGLRQLLKQ